MASAAVSRHIPALPCHGTATGAHSTLCAARLPGVRVLKAPVKALEAPAQQAKAAVQKAVQQPLAPVRQAAQQAASGFDGKKAEAEQAVKKPVAEARPTRWPPLRSAWPSAAGPCALCGLRRVGAGCALGHGSVLRCARAPVAATSPGDDGARVGARWCAGQEGRCEREQPAQVRQGEGGPGRRRAQGAPVLHAPAASLIPDLVTWVPEVTRWAARACPGARPADSAFVTRLQQLTLSALCTLLLSEGVRHAGWGPWCAECSCALRGAEQQGPVVIGATGPAERGVPGRVKQSLPLQGLQGIELPVPKAAQRAAAEAKAKFEASPAGKAAAAAAAAAGTAPVASMPSAFVPAAGAHVAGMTVSRVKQNLPAAWGVASKAALPSRPRSHDPAMRAVRAAAAAEAARQTELTKAAAAAAEAAAAAAPSLPSLPSLPSFAAPSLAGFGASADTAEALGVLAAELAGAAAATSFVGSLAAKTQTPAAKAARVGPAARARIR
jgi:hypothetical protein